MKKLIIIDGNDEREVELDEGKYYIGRLSSNQISLAEGGVSRRHAKIEIADGKAVLSDLGSLNGTYVNDREIRIHELDDEDTIEIGSFLLKYIDEDIESRQEEMADRALLGPEPVETPEAESRVTPALVRLLEKIPIPEINPKIRLGLWIIGLVLFTTFLVGVPVWQLNKQSIVDEAERRARIVVQYHAAINRDPLGNNQMTLLDVDSVTAESGVLRAYVLDNDGKLLRPTTIEEARGLDFQQAHQAETLHTEMLAPQLVRYAYPIRYENQRVGTAIVDVSLRQAYEQGQRPFVMIAGLGLLACGFAVVVSLILAKSLYRPVVKMTEETEVAIKADLVHEYPAFNVAEVNELSDTVQRLIDRALRKQTQPIDREELKGTSEGISLNVAQELAEDVPVGLVVASGQNRVQLANALARTMLGVNKQDVLGRHVLEVFAGGPTREALLKCLKVVSDEDGPERHHQEGEEGISVDVQRVPGPSGDTSGLIIILRPEEASAEATQAMPRLQRKEV